MCHRDESHTSVSQKLKCYLPLLYKCSGANPTRNSGRLARVALSVRRLYTMYAATEEDSYRVKQEGRPHWR